MVGVVSSIPSRGNFTFADFETPRCQFCIKMPEMSDLCYLGKTRFTHINWCRGRRKLQIYEKTHLDLLAC